MADRQDAPRVTVFVSYSRRDSEVADRISEALERAEYANIKVLMDRWNLPYGEPWWDMLVDFIQRCDRVIFLVSPDAVGSKWCLKEIEEMKRAGRRIVPVVVRDTRPADMPEHLRSIHALPFIGDVDFEMQISQLVGSLYRNMTWNRQRRVVDTLAEHWWEQRQATSLLLGADQVKRFVGWVEKRPNLEPPLSEVSSKYLDFSRFYAGREEHFTAYREQRKAAQDAWMNWVYLAGAYLIAMAGLCIGIATVVSDAVVVVAGWTATLLGGLASAVPAVRCVRRYNLELRKAVTDTEKTFTHYGVMAEANAFIEKKVAEEVKEAELENLREFKRKTEREAKVTQTSTSKSPNSTQPAPAPAARAPQLAQPVSPPTSPPVHIPSANDPLP